MTLYTKIVSRPEPNYNPWVLDTHFMNLYDACASSTLVDIPRCFSLWQLVKQVSHLDGALMEVGVWKGGTATIISAAERISNQNSAIYLCDTFDGVVKAGKEDGDYKGGEHRFNDKQYVLNLLKGNLSHTNNIQILSGIFPEETSNQITDQLFKFCHVDVDVYQGAKDIIEWIWPKMTQHGIMVFDDYGFGACKGVTKAVNEYFNMKDRLIIYNINGQAIMIKLSPVGA